MGEIFFWFVFYLQLCHQGAKPLCCIVHIYNMNYVVAFRLIGSLKANILRLLTFFLGWIQVSGEQKRSGFSFIHNQHLRCLSRVWQAIHLLSLRREHEAVHSSQEESASATIQWGIPEWLFLAISILRASDC